MFQNPYSPMSVYRSSSSSSSSNNNNNRRTFLKENKRIYFCIYICSLTNAT
ncbi:hypothetical protein M8C21_022875 [Ambrosia artemisiifolia]|uniref:Uncharacterized protein n=1 Tax=Ambrosia artemisiifolia TaxID=4212 RepID=A0AAD5CV96_AMBAR|nr:hypothetical protein M8C21_022875 [Ambrosia artemisiifolia]